MAKNVTMQAKQCMHANALSTMATEKLGCVIDV